MGNGMRGTRGMVGILYFGECCQTFREMSSNIPGNIFKHSEEYPQTFRGMSPIIPRNVLKHSGERPQIYRRMLCCQTLWGIKPSIPGNVCVTQGNEDARSVQDFLEFVVQNSTWNL